MSGEQPIVSARTYFVPTRLPRHDPADASAEVELPLTLNWWQLGRIYRMADRGDRARVYESVLVNGRSEDVARYVDGALLVDLFDELVLPREIRDAWAPLIAYESASGS